MSLDQVNGIPGARMHKLSNLQVNMEIDPVVFASTRPTDLDSTRAPSYRLEEELDIIELILLSTVLMVQEQVAANNVQDTPKQAQPSLSNRLQGA